MLYQMGKWELAESEAQKEVNKLEMQRIFGKLTYTKEENLSFFEQYRPFYIMIDKCREKKDNRDGTAQFRTELYFTHSRYANFSMFLQGFKE